MAVLLALALGGLPAGGSVSLAADAGSPLFATVTTPRREHYHHEVFEFTVAVHSRGLTLGREIALTNAETPGLRFLPFRDLGARREEIAGLSHDVHRFLGRAEATATGTFALRPTVRVSTVVPGAGRGAASRRDPSAPRAEIRQTELHPPPLEVSVRPLPEAGRPAAFAGAVGSFSFSASVRPAAAAVGEPVTLAMEVRGSGNVGSLGAPRVSAGERFSSYEPKLLRREISEDGAGGRLVFEQALVPRSTAATEIPAVTFAYFDPAREAYRELVRGPFPLAVRASAGPTPPPAGMPAAGPAAGKPRLPSAIAPLKPEPEVWPPAARSPLASPSFLALQLVPLAFVVVLHLVVRRREELARDVPRARRHLASGAGRPGLRAAERALGDGDAARFHDALWEAMSSYFGHRLNLRPGEVNGAAVTSGLAGAGLGAQDLARLGEIFDLLERERFAPPAAAAPPGEARQRTLARLLADAERLMGACEGNEA